MKLKASISILLLLTFLTSCVTNKELTYFSDKEKDELIEQSIKLNEKPYKLQNILDTLVFVRNSCAHSGVIYDLHIDEGVVEMSSYKFNNDYSHSLDAAIKALLYVMEYISLDRKNDLNEKLKLLFATLNNLNV